MNPRKRELRRFDAAAHGGPAFEHHAAKAGFRKIRRGDQAVVPRARHHNIETIRRQPPAAPWRLSGDKRQRSKRRALHESTPCDSAHPCLLQRIDFRWGQAFRCRACCCLNVLSINICPASAASCSPWLQSE